MGVEMVGTREWGTSERWERRGGGAHRCTVALPQPPNSTNTTRAARLCLHRPPPAWCYPGPCRRFADAGPEPGRSEMRESAVGRGDGAALKPVL